MEQVDLQSMMQKEMVWLVIAVIVTIYNSFITKNPHEPGTDANKALRTGRIGISFAWWAPGFGILGVIFSITAFVLGIVSLVKGGRGIGASAIVLSILLPIIHFYV